MSGKNDVTRISNDELPTGWANCDLGDAIGFMRNGMVAKQTKDCAGLPISRIETIAAGSIDSNRIGYSNDVSAKNAETYRLKNGDILFSHINSPSHLGKTAIYEGRPETLYHGMNLLMLQARQGLATAHYLEAALRFLRVSGTFSLVAQHAVNQASINQKKLSALKIPLAPLAEQKRIADKLEAVLGRVDACRTRLDRVPVLLKRFRQSVLAAATSGKLTEEWRYSSGSESAQHLVSLIAQAQEEALIKIRGGRIEPAIQDLQHEIDLPDKWVVAGFDSLAEALPNALKAGPFGSALKKSMYSPNGYKIYGQEQVIAGDENFGDYFINQAKFDDLSSCAVKPGDILISLVGTIGRVLILSQKCQPGIINPRLVKLSLHSSICREYIALYLRSPLAQAFFSSKSHGGTMDILNLGLLRELPILLPPLPEQQEIVRRVEALFAFADRIEARLATAQKTAERLTPATLAKAFRGELVPQDPNDEPAAELLERIASLKDITPAKKVRAKPGRCS